VVGEPIPDATPIADASGLKIKGIYSRRDLSRYEAANVLKATAKYLARKPSRRMARFDLAWLRKLHREMFGDVWTWAGQLRTTNLTIGIDHTQIETALFEMCASLRYQEESGAVSMLDQSVWLHHRAVHIHPFWNGNGRWSRLLTNIWLKQRGHPIIRWPEEFEGVASPIRDRYLAAIKAADAGEFGELTRLHAELAASAS